MPRQYNIKWRKQDKQKVTNTVRQFNSKITRVLKKNPALKPYLPDRINAKELTKNIQTRSDFNREINSLGRFLKKGAETPITTDTGLRTTQWQRKEIGYKVANINRQRTAERKRANVSTFTGTMGTIQKNNLEPKQYDFNKIKPSDWNKFVQNVEKQVKENYFSEKNELYKQNYMTAISNVFNKEDSSKLLSIIQNIPAENLIDLFYSDPVLQIDFVYDPLEASVLAAHIENHLNEYGYY